MPISDVRGDPQRPQDAQRINELEIELASLRQALLLERVHGQSHNHESNAQVRQQARLALEYQRSEFEDAARRHEQVSADATAAAVIRERSVQQAEQHRQLDPYRRTLSEVEANVSQREHTLRQALISHQEAAHGHVSQELAEQRALLVQEAEHAISVEKMRRSQLQSEYIQQLAESQGQAEMGLQQANNTIYGLRYSLQNQENSQVSLQEQLSSMQSAMDHQNRVMSHEIRTMQQDYENQFNQAQSQHILAHQELSLQYRVAEHSMGSEIASLKSGLEFSRLREVKVHNERQAVLAEMRMTSPLRHHR